jgi:hypothetical protein
MTIDDVPVLFESKRGCGFRKAGGLYLVAPELSQPCGKLPIVLRRCPVCSEGISFSRAPKWVEPGKLIYEGDCAFGLGTRGCGLCPIANPERLGEKALLIWVGEKHYATPQAFSEEAVQVGVSRRIKSVPKGFEIGVTWVLMAHPKVEREVCHCLTIEDDTEHTDPDCPDCDGDGHIDLGGIFTAFRPRAIEYVCSGDETEDELDKIVKRGLTPVRVKRKGETPEIPFMGEGGASAQGVN